MVKGSIRCWLTHARSGILPRMAVIAAGKVEEQDHLRLTGNSERISQTTPPPAIRHPSACHPPPLRLPTASAARAAGSRRLRATAPQTPDSLPCPHGRARPNSLPLRRLPQPQQRRQAGGARAGGAIACGRPAGVV